MIATAWLVLTTALQNLKPLISHMRLASLQRVKHFLELYVRV